MQDQEDEYNIKILGDKLWRWETQKVSNNTEHAKPKYIMTSITPVKILVTSSFETPF
jgi:hypothetical protein